MSKSYLPKHLFKTAPKWKMMLVRIFGKKITSCDVNKEGNQTTTFTSYQFKNSIYICATTYKGKSGLKADFSIIDEPLCPRE